MASQSFKLFQGSADPTSACGFDRSTSTEIEVWYDDDSGDPNSPYTITTLPGGSQLYKNDTLDANSVVDAAYLGGITGTPVTGNIGGH